MFYCGNSYMTAFSCRKTFTYHWIIEKDCLSLQTTK
nr:MAG TPA: hypothetical protein [Caudoviricetes sp.]